MTCKKLFAVKEARPFQYNPLLWAGLALWLGLGLLRYVLAWTGMPSVGNEALNVLLMDAKSDKSVFLLILSAGLLVPIVDEVLFRLWIDVRRTAVALLLFAGMGVALGFSLAWWAGALSFALCAAAYLLLAQKPAARVLALIGLTTLLYALHAGLAYGLNADGALVMGSALGLAMALCWVVLNMGFVWACLLHVVGATVAQLIWYAFAPPLAQPVAAQPLHIEGDGYVAILRPAETRAAVLKGNDSTYVLSGELPAIAMDLARAFDPDMMPGGDGYAPNKYLRYSLPSRKAEMSWTYTITFRDSIPVQRAPYLLNDLMLRAPLRADTTYEPAYVLGIEDSRTFNATMGGGDKTMAQLAQRLRVTYRVPVTLEAGSNEQFPVSFHNATFLDNPCDMRQLQDSLRARGLKFYKSDFAKLQVITFSYREDTTVFASACRRR